MAAGADQIEFRLIRMSDKLIHPNPIAAGSGIESVNASLGTINLNAILDTTAGAGGWNTALVAGDIYAVEITGPAATVATLDLEPAGIYTNLGAVSPFGVSAATFPVMRAIGFSSVADGGAAAPAAPGVDRTAIDLDLHLQGCIDRIYTACGIEKAPNLWLAAVSQRSRYVGLSSLTTAIRSDFTNRTKVGGLDQGYDVNKLGYGGLPIKVSRHVGNGHWIALYTESWKLAELGEMKWAETDGNVLSRVANADVWEGFMRWYVNFVCLQPHCNGVVTGLAL